MELIFLGTGTSQGVPMIGCKCEVCCSKNERDHRLRSSVMVTCRDTVVVVDTSMDFRQQMLRHTPTHLDGILLTHGHKDHVGGMDDLRAFNYVMNSSMDVYCEPIVQQVLHKDFDYAFAKDRYPGVPEINLHTIDTKPFRIKDLEITPIRGHHHRLPVLGFMFNNKICYLTDMNAIDDAQIEKIRGVEVLIINALRHKEHISHFTLDQAMEVIAKVAPGKAYLTHISHQLGLYDVLNPTLMEDGVEMAYDNLIIDVEDEK